MAAPVYLAQFNCTEDSEFGDSEQVYRRFPSKAFKPVKDLFSEITWDDISMGLSINRSKYSHDSNDVLWAAIEDDFESKTCKFEEREGVVGIAQAGSFPCSDIKTGAKFDLKHTPINCNISHCDLLYVNLPQNVNKPFKREVRAYLASFFYDINPPKL